MPDSGYCGNRSLRESPAPGFSIPVECARRSTQGLCLLTSSPLALTPPPDGSQVLQHLSAEGAVGRRWGDPKEGGWRREAQHQETRSPRDSGTLFQPRCSPILWVHEACFRGRRAAGIWRVWSRAERTRRSECKGGPFVCTGSWLPQPRDSPALGPKTGPAPGL